jgi:CelD/BcsL family acetyltransferase involved in cellulose biosynthesis
MQVSVIDNFHRFDELKANWETVYLADPHAQIFASWMWFRGWFEMTPYAWFVLAVRTDETSPYVAFFPLVVRGLSIHGFSPVRVLHMGGRPLAASTGFLCLPGYEEQALATLARYIRQKIGWDRFEMEDVLDSRLDLFLSYFPQEEFNVQKKNSMPSLYVPLPDNWDQYLEDFLGSKTRRNLRRSLKKINELKRFHVGRVQAENLDRNIEVLLAFWQQRWGPKRMTSWHHSMLHHLFENHCLWLTVFWDDTTPVAASSAFLDHQKKTFYGHIICHNPKYAKLSPGTAMIGYSIQHAIENGFQIYDFSLGGDAYKSAFGAKQRATKNVIIMRKSLRGTLANAVANMSRHTSESLVKILGKIKRIGIVKRAWFWLRTPAKR